MCEVTDLIYNLPEYESGTEQKPLLKILVEGGVCEGKAVWTLSSKKKRNGEICARGVIVDSEHKRSQEKPLNSWFCLSEMTRGREYGGKFRVSELPS